MAGIAGSPRTDDLRRRGTDGGCRGAVVGTDRVRRPDAGSARRGDVVAPSGHRRPRRGVGAHAAVFRIRVRALLGGRDGVRWCGGTRGGTGAVRRLHGRAGRRRRLRGVGGPVGPVRTRTDGHGTCRRRPAHRLPPGSGHRTAGVPVGAAHADSVGPRHTSGPHRRAPHPPIRLGRRVRGHPAARAGGSVAQRQLAGERPARPVARHRTDHGPRRGRRGRPRHHPAGAGTGVGEPAPDRARRDTGGADGPAARRPGRGRRPRAPAAMARRRHRTQAVLPNPRHGARLRRRRRRRHTRPAGCVAAEGRGHRVLHHVGHQLRAVAAGAEAARSRRRGRRRAPRPAVRVRTRSDDRQDVAARAAEHVPEHGRSRGPVVAWDDDSALDLALALADRARRPSGALR